MGGTLHQTSLHHELLKLTRPHGMLVSSYSIYYYVKCALPNNSCVLAGNATLAFIGKGMKPLGGGGGGLMAHFTRRVRATSHT